MTQQPKRAEGGPIMVEVEVGKKYAWCSCGESNNQPFCDGKHKGTDFKPVVFEAEKTESLWLCACKQTKKGPKCDGSHSESVR